VNISSSNILVKRFGFSIATNKTSTLSSAAISINASADAALARRKSLAVERMKGLQERLAVTMMFAALGTKGNAGAAAQIAKEIAGTVKDYADASGANTDVDPYVLNQEDKKFLGLARALSYQVKSIISFEAARARYPEKHKKEISQMDAAINDAGKSLGHDRTADLYSFDGNTLALLKSHFSASA